MPQFSVIMANFNRGQYIAEAIGSVLNQSCNDWELIIVDDASTDDSIAIIRQFLDHPQIKLVTHEKNRGYTAALKTGIGNISCEYFGLLDSDDMLTEEAVKAMIEAHTNNPDAGYVYSQFVSCDAQMKPIQYGYCFPLLHGRTNLDSDLVSHFKTFKLKYYCMTKGFDEEIFAAEDKDISYRMEEVSKLFFINKVLYKYRILNNSQSHTPEKHQKSLVNWKKAKCNALIRRNETVRSAHENCLDMLSKSKLSFQNGNWEEFTSNVGLFISRRDNLTFSKIDSRKYLSNGNNTSFVLYIKNESAESLKIVAELVALGSDVIVVLAISSYPMLDFLVNLRIMLIYDPTDFGPSEAYAIGFGYARCQKAVFIDTSRLNTEASLLNDCIPIDYEMLHVKRSILIADEMLGRLPAKAVLECKKVKGPLVSVIIRTCNSPTAVIEAVLSVEHQTYEEIEIIIVNNGGIGLDDLIYKLKLNLRKKVTYVNLKSGDSKSTAWRAGIEISSGKYMAYLEDNQVFNSNYVQMAVDYLEKAETKIVFTRMGLQGELYLNSTHESCISSEDNISLCAIIHHRNYFKQVGVFDMKLVDEKNGELLARMSQLFDLMNGDSDSGKVRKKSNISIDSCDHSQDSTFTVQNCSNPVVSVIIPTYNRPTMLAESISSVLEQTFQDFEIIVVNDGGVEVRDIIMSFDSPKIVYLVNSSRKGIAATRNAGLKAARGKYIVYLDDDDIYYPDHLQTLLTHLEKSGCKAAYTDAYKAHQMRVGDKYITTKREPAYSIDYDEDLLLVKNFIPTLNIMHEKSCVEDVGYFDEHLTSHEDWDLWIRISRKYGFSHINKITCEFRWRIDGSSTTSSKLADYVRTAELIYKKHLSISQPHVILEQQRSLQRRRKKLAENNFCSIVIPVFNKLDLTAQCLEAILQNTPDGLYELIVVDNASTDDTANYLCNVNKDIKIITNQQNLGFAKACNLGARAAQGNYLVFLNNDTIPLEGWLTELVDALISQSDIGVVGSKLLYLDNSIQHCGASMRHDGNFFRHHYKFLHRDHPLVNRKRELDAVTAACFITPRPLFEKLGGFDERYLNGCEDMDYCTAAREAGYRILYNPDAVLYHLESQTPRMRNMDSENFARYVSKWGVGRMKNEIEIYAEDGFWDSDENLFAPSANASALLTDLRNTFNPACPEPGVFFKKIATRIYPVSFWEKFKPLLSSEVASAIH